MEALVVKTRVHDLAAEFGVAPEQLLNMLKDMNIFVRSHMSALENDQVSAVRVRWEREKRKHAELAALELERPIVELEEPVPAQSLEERARALFKDLPPAPAELEEETAGAE